MRLRVPSAAIGPISRVAWATGKMPPGLRARLAGEPVEVDGQVLDPDIKLALSTVDLVGVEGVDAADVGAARRSTDERARLVRGRTVPVQSVAEMKVPGAEGPLDARLYVPRHRVGRGLLVFFHGGGWTVGSLDSHDQPCRFLAAHSGQPVLSVAYRLAPENPFPDGLEDALASFRWAVENAESLGADPDAVGVGGDSAGGNLAAVVSNLTASDAQPPAMQVLLYPVCDLTRPYRSYDLFGEGYYLTNRELRWYDSQYLSGGAGDPSDPRVSPLLEPDLSGVAPAYLMVAGFDPLRDEGLAYGRRLGEAGVPLETRVQRGLVHGFINGVGVARGPAAGMHEVAAAVRAGLA